MKKKYAYLFLGVVYFALITLGSCRKAEPWEAQDYDPRLAGGAQTVFSQGVGAFASAFPTLSGERLELHELGDEHFETTFIAAPAPLFQGLGTIYNNNSCFNCHINDGRGKPILGSEPLSSILFRISVPGNDVHGGPVGAPGYGGQLQDKAVFGYEAEGNVTVSWPESVFLFSDNDSAAMRSPLWSFSNMYTGSVPGGWMFSARVAPPLHGLGLLEQISEETMMSFADENDRDNDGISGKLNYVWDVKNQRMMPGRFGWKCEAATMEQQVAGAYNEDMGVTSSLLSKENSFSQPQHFDYGNHAEVPDSIFNAVVFYVRTLAVPARRDVIVDNILHGETIFAQAKCAGCHIPSVRTKTDVSFPEASNQLIRPYTDLLLHDMGPGLADNRPTFNANGNEWRTPPLWGIGLTQLVNGHSNFLHDGRARNLMEAILWHGGEAEYSKQYVKNLSKTDRDALIAFLKSL
jgi:CxxC motif-containing protein (DUF1111 family)